MHKHHDPRGSGAGRGGSLGSSEGPQHNRNGHEPQDFNSRRYLADCDYALEMIQKAAPRIATADPDASDRHLKEVHECARWLHQLAKAMVARHGV